MTLSTCGIVVAQKDERLIVQVESESCSNCTLNCVRIGIPTRISALGSAPVGVRVRVSASSKNLLLASFLVMGLPVVISLLAAIIWQSIVAVMAALFFSLLGVYLITKLKFFPALLRTQAERLD